MSSKVKKREGKKSGKKAETRKKNRGKTPKGLRHAAEKQVGKLGTQGHTQRESLRQHAAVGSGSLVEQHQSIREEDSIIAPSGSADTMEFDDAERFIAAVKSHRLDELRGDSATYVFRCAGDTGRTTEQLRSKLTRVLRLNGYAYSTSTRKTNGLDRLIVRIG